MSERLKTIALAIALFGMATLTFWGNTMDAMRDALRFSATFEPAPDVQLLSGSCKTKYFVLNACELKLRDKQANRTISHSYLFAGSYDGRNVQTIRDSKDPSFITTNLGQDRVVNRLLLSLPIDVMFLLAGLQLLFRLPKNTPSDRTAQCEGNAMA